jgi:hypothetical protein
MTPKELNLSALMWSVVGHDDPDDLKAGKCGRCGADFKALVVKIHRQGGALQEDCCNGCEIRKKETAATPPGEVPHGMTAVPRKAGLDNPECTTAPLGQEDADGAPSPDDKGGGP